MERVGGINETARKKYLIGDDLFVTNKTRLQEGIERKAPTRFS